MPRVINKLIPCLFLSSNLSFFLRLPTIRLNNTRLNVEYAPLTLWQHGPEPLTDYPLGNPYDLTQRSLIS